MGKSYINNAVVGNGSMLGCISETGELIRLYWPEIDHPQHIEKMLTGFLMQIFLIAPCGLVKVTMKQHRIT